MTQLSGTETQKHLDSAHVYVSNNVTCESCLLGRITRQVAKRHSEEKTKSVLELVHSDVAQLPDESLGGNKYIVTFIDDYSRFATMYFLKRKNEVFTKLKDFVALAERQTGARLKRLRDDKGSEYISKEMKSWMKERGIMYQETHKAAPYENPIAERYNRTIFDKVRTNLAHTNLPQDLWAECAATVNHCKNRLPHATIDDIPYKRWIGNEPMTSNMKEWGQKVIFHVQDRDKLQPRGKRGRLVGYNVKNTKGYRIYDPTTQKIILTKDIVCLNERTRRNPEYIEPDLTPDQEANAEYAIVANQETLEDDPKTFTEALNGQHKNDWTSAMDLEWSQLHENDTFEVVDASKDVKPIKCKWVYKTKLNADGTIERRKARLVAKGFSQREGVDFFETFAPVARLESIRIVLATALKRKYKVYQADVKNAYLNGIIDTEIYMQFPEGYEVKGKVLRLKKGLYGLRQAGKLWYDNFDEFMNESNYTNLRSDPCIYIGDDIIIVIYVDDIIIAAPPERIRKYISVVRERYNLQQFRELSWILGINVHQIKNEMFLSQELYIEKILCKFNMSDCKPQRTPAPVNTTESEGEVETNVPFRELVGSLLYLANATRPDIAHAVAKLSQRVASPTKADWIQGKRILRYLKGTKHLGLHYQHSSKSSQRGQGLEAYADASYGAEAGRKSTSGVLTYIDGNLVTWSSKKQSIVAQSTVEAEYIALAECTKQVLWIRQMIIELNDMDPTDTTTIHQDNQGTIQLASNAVVSSRSKHIDIRYHMIRDEIKKGTIQLSYLQTDEMIADVMTKSLPKEKFEEMRHKLKLRAIPTTDQIKGKCEIEPLSI